LGTDWVEPNFVDVDRSRIEAAGLHSCMLGEVARSVHASIASTSWARPGCWPWRSRRRACSWACPSSCGRRSRSRRISGRCSSRGSALPRRPTTSSIEHADLQWCITAPASTLHVPASAGAAADAHLLPPCHYRRIVGI
jgi:hypothetical protein